MDPMLLHRVSGGKRMLNSRLLLQKMKELDIGVSIRVDTNNLEPFMKSLSESLFVPNYILWYRIYFGKNYVYMMDESAVQNNASLTD